MYRNVNLGVFVTSSDTAKPDTGTELKNLLHVNVQSSEGVHVYRTRGASSLHHNTCPVTKWLPGAHWFAVFCKLREIHAVHFEVMLLYRNGRLCGLVERFPGYITEMYCVSCEVRTEFIYLKVGGWVGEFIYVM
jgi:hypothetical protein